MADHSADMSRMSKAPSARRQARLNAIVALLDAGWTAERIAMTLSVSRATVERLTPPPAAPRPPALVTFGVCCHRAGLLFCDAPVTTQGAVYCAIHRGSAQLAARGVGIATPCSPGRSLLG
jgi:hypothetical protein